MQSIARHCVPAATACPLVLRLKAQASQQFHVQLSGSNIQAVPEAVTSQTYVKKILRQSLWDANLLCELVATSKQVEVARQSLDACKALL